MSKKEKKAIVEERTEVVAEVLEKAKVRERKPFADSILEKVDRRYQGKFDEILYNSLREQIKNALEQIEQGFQNEKLEKRQKHYIFGRLSKFSKEDIESYLKNLN